MLKLFTPSEAKSLNTAQNNRDLVRTTELQESVRRLELKLIDAEASFNETLARQRTQWAEEEKAHAERCFVMDNEVKALEQQKEQALIPIADIEKRAHTMLNEAEVRLSEVAKKEIEIEELENTLLLKIDSISEQTQLLKDEADKLSQQKKARQEEEELQKLNRKSLSESIIKFNLYVEEQQAIISQEKTNLILTQRSIEARDALLSKRERELEADIIRLNDGRETLKRAFARINMNPNDVINYPNTEVAASADGSNQPVAATVEEVSPETEEIQESPVQEAPTEEIPEEVVIEPAPEAVE